MADYTLSAVGTYDGSDFEDGIARSQSKLEGFSEKCDSIGSRVRNALGNGFVKAASVVTDSIGTITAGITAMAATGGISRALKLEQAEHLFDGLGLGWESLTEKIDETTGAAMSYKDIVNEAVADTQFSLDEAAVVAANLGASGIKSGEQMSQALRAATGVASTFGTSLGDVGDVFTKIAAQGKVSGENIQQLTARGIPALQTLAEHLGKTTEEVSAMVSKGQIDFQTFSDAMDEAFGANAKSANDTFAGSLANVRAALSRVGAKFATPGLDALKSLFNEIRPLINAVNTALDPMAERFEKFLGIAEDGSVEAGGAVAKLTEIIRGLTDKVNGLGEGGFDNLSAKSKVLAAAIGLLSVGSIAGLASQIPVIGGAFGGLAGVLGDTLNPVSLLRNGIDGLNLSMDKFSAASKMAGGGMTGFKAGLGAVLSPATLVIAALAALAAAFVYLMATDEEFRATVMGLAGDIAGSLAPVLATLKDTLLPAIGNLITTLLPIIAQVITVILQIVAAVAPLVSTIASAVIPIIAKLIEIVAQVVQVIAAVVMPIIQAVTDFITEHMDTINAVVSTVLDVICGIVQFALDVISGIVSTVLAIISGDWEGAWNAIKGIAETVWNAISGVVTSVFGGIRDFITGVLDKIKSIWNSVWGAVSSFVSETWSNVKATVKGGVQSVCDFVGSIPDSILGFFSNAGSLLVGAGKAIISGLLNGIKSAIGGVFDFVSGIGSKIASLKGPKQYDLKLLVPNGGWIMKSLTTGLRKGEPGLFKELSRITGDISGWQFGSPEFSLAGSQAHGGDYRQTLNVTVNVEGRDALDFKGIDTLLEWVERAQAQ